MIHRPAQDRWATCFNPLLRIVLRDHDRLEWQVAADSLVRTRFIEPLAVDEPMSLAELEDRRGMPSFVREVERARLEMHADQRQ